ncbi:MAG: glycosyltransferase family 39 protein [Candidatus Nanoarchaeia archaeon]|nr:glycosyltransferase family 39 protein [Candidatus Nanoarchaeia archaeon]
MNLDKKLVLILGIYIFTAVILYDYFSINWDEAVYILNAKHFAGENIYFELFRPPVLPLILSPLAFFTKSYLILKLIPIMLNGGLVVLVYKLSKQYIDEKTALFSSLFLATNTLFQQYSVKLFTGLPMCFFAFLAIYFFMKKKTVLSAFFMAVTFLTRYPGGLIFLILLYYLFKKEFKKFALSILIITAVITPWVIYNYYQSPENEAFYFVKYGILYPSEAPAESPLYFFEHGFDIYSASIFLAPFLIYSVAKLKQNKFIAVCVVLLFAIFSFFQFSLSGHKEIRYLLITVPFFTITAVNGFFKSPLKEKKWILILILVLHAGLSSFITYMAKVEPGGVINIEESSEYMKTLPGAWITETIYSGRTASVLWPLTAYFSEKQVSELPAESSDFNEEWLIKNQIRYIYSVSNSGWPEYALNKSFFNEKPYLVLIKTFESCNEVNIYEYKG